MAKQMTAKSQSNLTTFDESILLEDVGAGQEGMGAEDLMIPRLTILQQMSDQVNKRHGSYIDGAEPGMIMDSVSNVAYDGEQGITVVPISYRRAHIEWKADRGGLVADHGPDSSCLENCYRGGRGEYLTDEGNEIVPTGEYYVFVADQNGYTPALLSMAKSQLKKARQWNSMMNRLMIQVGDQRVNPAMFWTSYQLTTVPEENDQGSWFGWSIAMNHDAQSGGIIANHPIGQEIYLAARKFKSEIAAGEVKVSPDNDAF